VDDEVKRLALEQGLTVLPRRGAVIEKTPATRAA